MAEAKKNNRQAIVLGLVVIVGIFLVYMIYGMVKGGGTSAPPKANPQVAAAPPPPPPPPPPKEQKQIATPEMLAQEYDMQKQYVEALHQLDMLKIEQQTYETRKAIKAAELAIAETTKKLDVLQKPAPVNWSDYSQGLAANVPGAAPHMPQAPAPAVQSAPPTPEASYIVISVAMQDSHWNAVVGFQGKLYSVGVGDTLSADGSVVSSIDRNGVVLARDGEKKRIALTTTIN